MPTPQDIQRVVEAYFAATRAMDLDAWLATFAPDAVMYDPSGPPVRGHAALRQFFQGITAAFASVGLTEQAIHLLGSRAATQWVGEGVGKNGRRVKFEGIDVFEINDAGMIQTLWGYWDPAAMMAELSRA